MASGQNPDNPKPFDFNNRAHFGGQYAFGGGQVTSNSVTTHMSLEAQKLLLEEQNSNNIVMNTAIAADKDSKVSQGAVTHFLGGQQVGGQESEATASEFYELGSSSGPKKRGLCVVLNYQNYTNEDYTRDGSDRDVARIIQVFGKELNFEVVVHNDLKTRDRTEKRLKSELGDFEDYYHCFVLIILAHGEPDYFLCDIDEFGTSSDEQKFAYNQLFELFDGTNCKKLIDKPKLFFIQACQGSVNDPGTRLVCDSAQDTISSSSDQAQVDNWQRFLIYSDPKNIPSKADQLVFCCCYSNHFSIRQKIIGTWFIQDLCTVLSKNWKDKDLESMLTLVRAEVAKRQGVQVQQYGSECAIVKQMPEITSITLRKKVKFY